VDGPRTAILRPVHSRKIRAFRGYPPPPPSECLDWRGVCKKCLQNLDVKEVRGQNLDSKGDRPPVAVFIYTASALTIIRLLRARGKVRCHMLAVDFFGSRALGNPIGQPLANFFGGNGSTSFRVPNAFVDGGERFLVFLVEDGSRTLRGSFRTGCCGR